MGIFRTEETQKKPTTVAQYVEKKLSDMRWRYPDDDMLRAVSKAVAKQFNEPETLFPNPGQTPCNKRQIILIAALLELDQVDLHKLYQLAINEQDQEAGAQEKTTREQKEQAFLKPEPRKSKLDYENVKKNVAEIVRGIRTKRDVAKVGIGPLQPKPVISAPQKIIAAEKAPVDSGTTDFLENRMRELQDRLTAQGVLTPSTPQESWEKRTSKKPGETAIE